MIKSSLNGNTIYLWLLAMKGFNAIQPGYNCFIFFDENFSRIPPWVLALTRPECLSILYHYGTLVGRRPKRLVTNYGEGGGGRKRDGGAHEVLPLQKGGGGTKSLSYTEGGNKEFWGSFYAVG